MGRVLQRGKKTTDAYPSGEQLSYLKEATLPLAQLIFRKEGLVPAENLR